MKRLRERLCDERGFTLPEMMVTIFMMIVVLFALYSIFDASIRVFAFGNDRLEATQNARLGLERMEREIRAAYYYDEANDDMRLFPNFGPNPSSEIAFQNMQDSEDGSSLVGITYDLNGDTLERNDEAIVEDATALRFEHLDSGGAPASSEQEITLIRISLTVEAGDEGDSQELTTDVYLRNRQ